MSRIAVIMVVGVGALMAAACKEATLPSSPGITYGRDADPGQRGTQETDAILGASWDAKPAVDKPPSNARDAATPSMNVDARDALRADASVSSALECSLLTQACPRADGCYPFGEGGSRCSPVGAGTSGVPCISHDECAFRHFCQSQQQVCLELCEADLPCANGAVCIALPGYRNVGYCPQ